MSNHGSLQNMIAASGRNSVVPEVGMGATLVFWTDRKGATIVEVSASGKRIVVQEDKATRTDSHGMSDAQSYEHTPDPDAPRTAYTLRKNGRYVREGEPMKGGGAILIGSRSTYHDYSF